MRAAWPIDRLLDGFVEGGPVSSQMITGIACDSREVTPGTLFVAIEGFVTDGHRYIGDAVERGASAVIMQKTVEVTGIPAYQVKNSRRVLSLLASRFYGDPSKSIRLIGVTGTNGKTTTCYLLESIFKATGVNTGLIGTLVYRWKAHEELAVRTTPDAVSLQKLLYTMRSEGVEAGVMEVSSHALSLDRVAGIAFDSAVFTNLSRDHLDFYNSMASYGEAKSLLFSHLPPGASAVINGDDPAAPMMLRAATGRRIRYGTRPEYEYCITNYHTTPGGMQIELNTIQGRFTIETPLIGYFNVVNCTAAAAAALEMEVDPDAVKEGIANLRGVPGRMQWFDAPAGIRIIVDYAHTPAALENVLVAAREMTDRELTVLFGCGGDRDKGKRPEMGKVAAALADKVIITSDNPRNEDPDRIIEEIISGISDNKRIMTFTDRRNALEVAIERAQTGDTVLIAGKGHETYQEIKGKRFPFDDMQLAREIAGVGEEG